MDTVASFSCDDGYTLSGTRTRTCDSSGNWDNQEQTAICIQSNEKLSRNKNLFHYGSLATLIEGTK